MQAALSSSEEAWNAITMFWTKTSQSMTLWQKPTYFEKAKLLYIIGETL